MITKGKLASEGIRDICAKLSALSDTTRMRIIEALVNDTDDVGVCVGGLVEALGIDQPKISHHLAALRSAGLVTSERCGRHIFYRPAWQYSSGGHFLAGQRPGRAAFKMDGLSIVLDFDEAVR